MKTDKQSTRNKAPAVNVDEIPKVNGAPVETCNCAGRMNEVNASINPIGRSFANMAFDSALSDLADIIIRIARLETFVTNGDTRGNPGISTTSTATSPHEQIVSYDALQNKNDTHSTTNSHSHSATHSPENQSTKVSTRVPNLTGLNTGYACRDGATCRVKNVGLTSTKGRNPALPADDSVATSSTVSSNRVGAENCRRREGGSKHQTDDVVKPALNIDDIPIKPATGSYVAWWQRSDVCPKIPWNKTMSKSTAYKRTKKDPVQTARS